LDFADNGNILDGGIHTIKKNTGALLVGSKEIGLEVDADKIKYMVITRVQNAGRSHIIKIDNSSLGGKVQIFGKNLNKSKLYFRRNYKQIELGGMLAIIL